MCWLSEKVAKQTQCLKDKIIDEASEHPTGTAANTIKLQDDSNRICSLLDEFKGFDGLGFFTLNHLLLTSLFGFFFACFILNNLIASQIQDLLKN